MLLNTLYNSPPSFASIISRQHSFRDKVFMDLTLPTTTLHFTHESWFHSQLKVSLTTRGSPHTSTLPPSPPNPSRLILFFTAPHDSSLPSQLFQLFTTLQNFSFSSFFSLSSLASQPLITHQFSSQPFTTPSNPPPSSKFSKTFEAFHSFSQASTPP